ncbi:MAG: TIGR01212 family radical SAM protein [Bacilli bacterium]|nr:TIGR01212 family radical SAM protein [Bacilli bacterium]
MNYQTKERPYLTVNDFYREKFGEKVFRIPLNAGFTCPNRDGTLSYAGCIYCSEKGSGDFAGDVSMTLEEQYIEIKAMMTKKWSSGKTIVYFQANTNTYAPVDKLRQIYDAALNLDPNIVGISIATRPDCLKDDVLKYLFELNKKTFLTVELGLQTIHPETAKLINRQHDLETFDQAVSRLRKGNIHVVAHIINGLPHETKDMMLETVAHLNKLDIQGLKIHMLYITRDTAIAKYLEKTNFKLLTLGEYVEIVADQIELLRPDIILYRLTGDAPKEDLIAPMWSLRKFVVTNEIDKLLRRRKTYQGVRYQNDQSR